MASDLYPPPNRDNLEIRLLSLLPSDMSNEIRCELFKVSLDEDPSYQALSYTWGDTSITSHISLNSQTAYVTLNAKSALRRLRHSDRVRTRWIDTVCINQVDILGKNQQVALMGHIYSETQETLIWLGDLEETSQWRSRDMNISIPIE